MEKSKVRIDKYLWSIRLFKTRSLASEACEKGRVKLNGDNVKAAKNVAINDVYHVKTDARKWVIRVTGLLQNGLAYCEAINFYIDDKEEIKYKASAFHTGKRLSKIGRPTKKEMRDISGFYEGEEARNEN